MGFWRYLVMGANTVESFDASAHVDRFLRERDHAPKTLVEGEERDEVEQREDLDARAALQSVFLDAAERVAHKEAQALTRALSRHAGNAPAFNAWAGGFYADLLADALKAFAPAIASAEALLRSPGGTSDRVATELSAWLGGSVNGNLAPYCRNVASGAPEQRAQAMLDLVLNVVFAEASHGA